MAQDSRDFFAGYINEVQSYVPIIRKGIVDLRTAPGNMDVLDEVYRLTHIIRGASAMVGVNGLGQIAGCMETVMERIQEEHLELSPDLLAAMAATTERIDLFCQSLRSETTIDEEALLAETRKDFDKFGEAGAEQKPSTDEDALLGGDDILLAEFEGAADGSMSNEFSKTVAAYFEELHQVMQSLDLTVAGRVPVTGELRAIIGQGYDSLEHIRREAEAGDLHDIAAVDQLILDVFAWLRESAGSMDRELLETLSEALDILTTMIYIPASFDEHRAEEVLAKLHAHIENPSEASGKGEEPESSIAGLTGTEIHPEMDSVAPTRAEQGGGSLRGELFSEEEKQLLREGFQEEAEEHLQDLHQAMQIFEKGIDAETAITSEHREEIRRVRRSVHTIKGASAVIGLNEISSYAHGVEDFLDWLYEGARMIGPEMVNGLAESLDQLGLLVEKPDQASSERQAEILKRLADFSRGAVAVTTGGVKEKSLAESLVAEEHPQDAEVEEEEGEVVGEARQVVVSETAKTIRINQQQLDTLINLSNELLVGVSGFDQNMGLFRNALDELELTTSRLKAIALELETKFEVKALDRLSHHFSHLDNTIAQIKEGQSFAEFDALELDRYTQLNLIIRSLNESAIDVAAIHANLGGIYSGIGGDINRQHRVIRELQVQMLRTRMSPMSSLTSRLSRTMRDVALRLGKRVRLVVEGERVELDRGVWEKLADPLMHLIRNAVHHGVEAEADRLAAGKPAIATITLAAQREGNNIVLRFGDDGQGLDFHAIRAKARQFGLGAQADGMDERQLTDLIFFPGFSTKTISEISGRGVGMDVVKENVKELQGSIGVETRRGRGTTFVIRVPLTMGVLRALLVKVGEVTYAIALNDIKDIHRIDSHDISRQEGTCAIAGSTVPWYSLSALLNPEKEGEEDQRPLVLALAVEGGTIAVAIPQITGQKEIVIKGLGSHLRTVPGITGAAVMGDGSVVPVLDIPDLIQAVQQRDQAGLMPFKLDIPESFTVMIVDDSISIRRVMSRLVVNNGWVPVEAKDGLDAIEQLEMEEIRPDCIVLDIEMPRMNGFEFLSKLSNIRGGKDIPVIMLTSRTSAKHQEKAFQLGARAFLNKPCKDEEFVDTVLRIAGMPSVTNTEKGQGVVQ